MALVDVVEVKVIGVNPAPFATAYAFEITFECLEALQEDLEWKVVYVGSAGDETKDQTLEEVMVGPVPVGTSKFVLEADAPAWEPIPEADRLGVTVLSITCAYKSQPFVSVGYYVNNEYYPDAGPSDGGAPTVVDLPDPLDKGKVYRNVCVDEPRVTRYNVKWHAPADGVEKPGASEVPPGDEDVDAAEDDGDEEEDAGDDDDENAPGEDDDGDDDDDDDDDEDDREIDLEDADDEDEEDEEVEPAAKRPRTSTNEGDDEEEEDEEEEDVGEEDEVEQGEEEDLAEEEEEEEDAGEDAPVREEEEINEPPEAPAAKEEEAS